MLDALSIASSAIGLLIAIITSLRTSIKYRKQKKDKSTREFEELLCTYKALSDRNQSLSIELMNNQREMKSLELLFSTHQDLSNKLAAELLSSITTLKENDNTIHDDQISPQLHSQAITIHPSSPEKHNTTEE